MKRASYRHAIEWIALNDDSGAIDALEVDVVRHQISVVLVADLFDVEASKVAQDVVRYRIKEKQK